MTDAGPKSLLLIVERSPRFEEKLRRHLQVPGMENAFAASGHEALARAEARTPRFMLLNLSAFTSWDELHGLTAFAAAQRVPFLFVEGGERTRAVASRLRQKGFDQFMTLPFGIKDLGARIGAMLRIDPLVGRKLGPEGRQVELLSRLGSGASGQVYLACQGELDRRVAVKFLAPEHLDDREAVTRFYNEARAIAAMRSPHIVQVYFVGHEAERPYLVMEHINGPTLEKYLRSKGALKPTRALKLAREILLGLMEAHGAGKIHRDLKPANVMINPRGQAVILDFGLVRESDGTLTQAGMVMGTPRYISPEQVQGKPLDQRCDLYALGIMLFEMLTGRVPFAGNDLVALLWKHVKEPLPHPADLGAAVDPALWALIQTLCAKEPSDRFADAETVLRLVDAHLAGLDAAALTPAPSDTRDLLEQVQPIGGLAVDHTGTLTHRFGKISADRARVLGLTRGLLGQVQGMEDLGTFQRGLVTVDGHKLMVFSCFDGLAAIETDKTDITTRFNMMDTAELQSLFRREVT